MPDEFLSNSKTERRKQLERAERLWDMLPEKPENGDRPAWSDSPEKLSDKYQGLLVEAVAQSDSRADNAAVVVQTISDLRALDVSLIPSGALILVSGYYSAGDGGGGLFRLDKSDTSTADDGGATIALTSGSRAKALFGAEVPVLRWGAKADGTDSRSRIQSAVDFCAATRNTLAFPPGVFRVSGPIQVSAGPFSLRGFLGQKAAATASGSSQFVSETYIKLLPGSNTSVLEIGSGGFVSVFGLAFDGDRTNQTGSSPVCSISGGTYPQIHFNCVSFVNGAGDGVSVSGRSEIIFEKVKSLFNNGNGISLSSSFDVTFDYVHTGFNKQNGLVLSGCRSIRSHKLDSYFNALRGVLLDNTAVSEFHYTTSNDNGQEAIRFATYGIKLRFFGGNFQGANRLSSSDGGWTNPAPTGTYPLVSFNDTLASAGLYDVDFFGVTFTGLSGSSSNGLPKYILEDNRVNATARDGYGIRLFGGSLPGSTEYVSAQVSPNLFGKLCLVGVYNFNGFVTDVKLSGESASLSFPTSIAFTTASAAFSGALSISGVLTASGGAVVSSSADGTGVLTVKTAAGSNRLLVDTLNGRTVAIGPSGPGSDPSYGSGTTLVVKNNVNSTDRCRVVVVGGPTGFSTLEMGSTLGYGLQVDEANTRLNFRQNGTTPVRLNGGRVAVCDGTIADPDGNAALDVQSTSRGFKVPSLTTTQRDAMTSPNNGIVIYNTTLGKFQGRAAGVWADLN